MAEPKQESLDKMWKFAKGFAERAEPLCIPCQQSPKPWSRASRCTWMNWVNPSAL